MSAKTIILVVIFMVGLISFIYSINHLMGILDLKSQREAEDKIFFAHGCYMNPAGDTYICPNGLPPTKTTN